MNQDLYRKAEQFVIDSFNKIGEPDQIKHFIRTVHWIKVLNPKSDEALLISAVAHDIERAYRQKDVIEKKYSLSYTNTDFFRPHEERGAEIIASFLHKNGALLDLIDRVKTLVSRHEEGGNDDQDLLKDADSLSYFENNVQMFLDKHVPDVGKQKVKDKFDWMFDRITSTKAKQIARPWYEEAIKKLES